MLVSEDHFMEIEINVLLTTVPRAMVENVGYSYLAATWWEAIVSLTSPTGFINRVKAISWESRRHVDTRIKLNYKMTLN